MVEYPHEIAVREQMLAERAWQVRKQSRAVSSILNDASPGDHAGLKVQPEVNIAPQNLRQFAIGGRPPSGFRELHPVLFRRQIAAIVRQAMRPIMLEKFIGLQAP